MDDQASALDPDGRLASAVSDCVHCGFCLPACPTYQLWGEEMDSPRGRIHLISQVLGGAPLTEAVTTHLDRCLGCMACMPACPSGVRYNELIEAARTWTEDPPATLSPPPARSRRDRAVRAAIFATFPYPRRLRALTGPLRAAQWAGLDRALQRSRALGRVAPELVASLRLAPKPRARHATALRGQARGRALPLALAQRGARMAAVLDRARMATPPGRARTATPPGRARTATPRGGARVAAVLDRARMAALLNRARPGARPAALPGRIPAVGARRAVVGLLTGCVQRVFFPEVNAATARVLAAEGCEVIIPAGQGCCGALSLHSGRAPEAARFARHTIATFEAAGVDMIVVNSAGCGSAMKEYAALLANTGPAIPHPASHSPDSADGPDSPGSPRRQPPGPAGDWAARAAAFDSKVRDFSEFLIDLYEHQGGPRAVRHELPVTAAYHDACHLAHAQRIREQPRDLLRGIPGLEVAEAGDGGTCCGSAGVYNLLQPEAARDLGAQKAATLRATGAHLIVSGNPGCTLQIAAALTADGGGPVAVVHIAEVLDASLRGLSPSALASD